MKFHMDPPSLCSKCHMPLRSATPQEHDGLLEHWRRSTVRPLWLEDGFDAYVCTGCLEMLALPLLERDPGPVFEVMNS